MRNKAALFFTLLVLCFFALEKLGAYSFVKMDLSSSRSALTKIYWKTTQSPQWSEDKSVEMAVLGRKKNHIMMIPVATEDITHVRIDPSTRRGTKTIIRELNFHHLNTPAVRFRGQAQFSKFIPSDDVISLEVGNQLVFKSSGNDAWYQFEFPKVSANSSALVQLLKASVLALFIYGLLSALPWLLAEFRWVALGMGAASLAVLMMAILSKDNAHPDEGTHLKNAQYYEVHYAPPEACSDDTLYTYTTYGVSRLDNREIAYYVGGRYLQLVDFIPAPALMKLRYFNVALFLIMAFLAIRQIKARLLFLPLMLTPQSWYLFSYYNSDALSLFAVVMAAYQVFVSNSMLRRLLRGERPSHYFIWVAMLALLFAMQYWVKLNYIFYPIFLLMLAVSWLLLYRRKPALNRIMPVLMAFILGTGLFLSWEVSRHVVNDFSLSEKATACREKTAHKLYKPSTSLAQTHPNFNLRGKGETLIEMITERNWSERIFFTGLGAYGYLEFLNSSVLYKTQSALILLLFIYAIFVVFIKGNGLSRMSVLAMLAAMLGITFAAILNNWDQDYQPQGRYLMVYLPLFGSMLLMNEKRINLTLVSGLGWVLFSLALYSFIAIGLVEIPKL